MPETPVTEFGARLKQARLARGISLAQIASVTKISVRSLEAVERNDFSRLPGGIFTRAFVRAYAAEVGLDPEQAIRQFLAQCPDEMAAVPTGSPASIEGPRNHGEWQEKVSWQPIAVALAVVVVAIVAWYSWSRTPAAPGDAVGASAEIPAADLPSAQAMDGPADPTPARQVEPVVGAAVPALQPASAAPPSARLVVALVASAPCWTSVSADGEPVASRLLTAGERIDVRAGREVVVKVGDAAALALTVNGRQARSLGAPGRVVTLTITSDNWTSFVEGG